MKHKTPVVVRAVHIISLLVLFWLNIIALFECYSGGHYKFAALCATAGLTLAATIITLFILFLIEDNLDDYDLDI